LELVAVVAGRIFRAEEYEYSAGFVVSDGEDFDFVPAAGGSSPTAESVLLATALPIASSGLIVKMNNPVFVREKAVSVRAGRQP
jgi:hypothetical protein